MDKTAGRLSEGPFPMHAGGRDGQVNGLDLACLQPSGAFATRKSFPPFNSKPPD